MPAALLVLKGVIFLEHMAVQVGLAVAVETEDMEGKAAQEVTADKVMIAIEAQEDQADPAVWEAAAVMVVTVEMVA